MSRYRNHEIEGFPAGQEGLYHNEYELQNLPLRRLIPAYWNRINGMPEGQPLPTPAEVNAHHFHNAAAFEGLDIPPHLLPLGRENLLQRNDMIRDRIIHLMEQEEKERQAAAVAALPPNFSFDDYFANVPLPPLDYSAIDFGNFHVPDDFSNFHVADGFGRRRRRKSKRKRHPKKRLRWR